jgi:L,D-transpeptidase YcbB
MEASPPRPVTVCPVCVSHRCASLHRAWNRGYRGEHTRVLVRYGRVLCAAALALTGTAPGQMPENSYTVPADEYTRTRDVLERYRVLAAEDDGAILPATARPVQPGDHYEGVPRLVRLLTRLGDLSDGEVFTDADLYQGKLAKAVERFQRRHGLDPDGRIDKKTLAQLNTPLSSRVHQLELALERWRRRPYDPALPAIVLNLPEFRLRAFRGGQMDLEMKIVVGQAPDHKTPLLSSQLESVIFRPYWNVPLSIQTAELVPEILKDPSFLSANHFQMVTMQGDVVEEALSDEILSQLRSGGLRLRQTPGPANTLGLAKFVFPNDYQVYMHATSMPGLFDRRRRDLSHGCIRVERAVDLAEWALRDEPDWPRDRILKTMHGSESVAVTLTRPIQVVTTYVTAVVLGNAEVHFFDDIYGEDQALEQKLTASPPSREASDSLQ